MRIGIHHDLRDPSQWARGYSRNLDMTLERIEEAENLGINSVWCTEHHFFADGYLPQPLTWCAAVAARTKRIQIGTAIVIAPLHHPLEIAEQAAFVDQLSNGRLQLGFGAGYIAREFDAYGADKSQRFELTESRVVEVKKLLSDGMVTPGPIQEPIPMWLGAFGPRGARMAGRTGVGLMWLDGGLLEPYRQGLVEGGHSSDKGVMGGLVSMIISNDPERAWATVAPHIQYQWKSYADAAMAGTESSGMTLLEEGKTGAERSSGPIMLPPSYDAVTPDEAVRRIEAWLGDLPVADIWFYDTIAGMPDDLVEENLRLLATEVAPRLARVGIVTTAAH